MAKVKAKTGTRKPRGSSPPPDLAQVRARIGPRIKELRHGRGWSQRELAHQLGLSQNRLSEIERGDGSFTAEQFLKLLRLFNVTPGHFVDVAPRSEGLQNALARFGAAHLLESSEVLRSDQLEEVHEVICEALLDASPRLLTATAAVFVRNARTLSFQRIFRRLHDVGRENRLGWAVENTLLATRIVERSRASDATLLRLLREAQVLLQLFVDFATTLSNERRSLDVLEPSVRSQQTLAILEQKLSPVSRRWGIVSRLQPEDFASALEAALGSD